jgi:hypothetical protein
MAVATAMYHSGRNVLHKVVRKERPGDAVETPKSKKQRELHKAFLRWHDRENWPVLREALHRMGRDDLIGSGPGCLVPAARGQRTAPHSVARPATPGRAKGPGRRTRRRKA